MKEKTHRSNACTFIEKKDAIQGNGGEGMKIMKANAAACRIKNRTDEEMVQVDQHGE